MPERWLPKKVIKRLSIKKNLYPTKFYDWSIHGRFRNGLSGMIPTEVRLTDWTVSQHWKTLKPNAETFASKLPDTTKSICKLNLLLSMRIEDGGLHTRLTETMITI